MDRTVTKGILWVAVSLVAVGPLPSTAEARGRGGEPECLAPGGTDDTAALQAALQSCTRGRHRCVVRLCEGRFKVQPVRVGHFRGTLRGAGQERTILEALPDLAVNDNPDGYWQDDPLDPELDPWPFLVQFVGGRVEVRDLAVEVPTPPEGLRPTRGWSEFAGTENFELAGAILVTGRHRVHSDVKRVRITAGEDPENVFETTLRAGVSIRGLLLNPEDPSEFPVHPVGGHHRLSEAVLDGMVSGVALGELAGARVTLGRSRTTAFIGVDLLDADRSHILAFDNRWDVEAVGFQAFLNIDGNPSRHNLFLVVHNEGAIGPYFGFGSGIYVQDPVILPEPGESKVIVVGNTLDLGTPAEPAFSGIELFGAGRLHASWNHLGGHVSTVGVGIDQTVGCGVLGNDLAALEVDAGIDVRLGPGTSRCLAIVSRDDVVQDDGTDNRVCRH